MTNKSVNLQQSTFDSDSSTWRMPGSHYSGNQLNPYLREFIGQYGNRYSHEEDAYSPPPPFDVPIETTKATAVYNMHTFWSKKPHGAIRTYIEHYTQPGDLILDPFAGSGGTGTACRQCSRNAILADLSPFCSFLSVNYSHPLCFPEATGLMDQILRQLEKEYEWMYLLAGAHAESFLHSDKIRCLKCLRPVYVADCEAEGKSSYACPECGEKWSSRSDSVEWLNGDVWGVFRKVGRSLKLERLTNDERRLLEKTESRVLQELEGLHLPDIPIAQALLDLGGRLNTTNTTRIHQLYSVRVRLLLARMLERIQKEASTELQIALKFIVSSALLNLTLMYQYRKGGGGKPGGGGAYYVPPVRRELNFFNSIRDKLTDVIKGRMEQVASFYPQSQVIVSTEDALRLLQRIPVQTIDYIFTDPPYADTMPYAALNCVWDYWLFEGKTNYADEILGNNWRTRMERIADELFRVLKPGRCISVCYHDTSEGTWEDLQDVMAMAGFVVEQVGSAIGIDTTQKAYQQIRGDKVVRRDLVINFRKPKPGELVGVTPLTGREDETTFAEQVRQIIRQFLLLHPGATKDRVYDEVTIRMVRKGQMEAHNFDALLRSVADEVQQPVKEDLFRNKEADLFGSHVQNRWYLKETADQVDQAEQAKEDAAAARLSNFVGEYLSEKPELEGVHYSDLFEEYLPVHDKPRRLLADWLPEYFIKTPNGTWRLPDEEEAQQLARLRETGTLRRIKRFANTLIDGVPVREKDRPGSDVDLLDWLRQCRRAGLYEQGKAIYEKGGLNSANLTEEQQIEAEDDYRICVRRGSTEEPKPKHKRRKK